MSPRSFAASGGQTVLAALAIRLWVLTTKSFGATRFLWRAMLWMAAGAMLPPMIAAQHGRPSAPTNLRATATSSVQISLTWSAPGGRILASYSIWRCQGKSCQNFAQIGSVEASSTS
jgi:hypothetical protein